MSTLSSEKQSNRFDEETDDQPDESGGRGGGGRGGRRRGGRRGPAAGGRDRRRGSEMFDDRPASRAEQLEGGDLRKYTSAESLNRGLKGHRGRSWREREKGFQKRGRDEGYEGKLKDYGSERLETDRSLAGQERDAGFGGRRRGGGFEEGEEDGSYGGKGNKRRPSYGYGSSRKGRFGSHEEGRGGERAGLGVRGGGRPFQVRHFLDVMDPADTTLKLTSKLYKFEDFVKSERISTDETSEVLRILWTILDCDMHRESVLKILQVVCNSPFLSTHLSNMLLNLESLHTDGLFSEEQLKKVQQNVEMMCKLISHICTKLPTHASKGYLLLTSLSSSTSVMAAVRKKTGLEEEAKDLMSICQKKMKMAQDTAEQRQQTRRVIGRNRDDEIPPEDFSELSIFPTGQDMEWSEKPFLRANKTEGGYRDVSHYLDVQFRLLREDYIRPLRTGIREYQVMKEKGESLMKNQDLRLYHNIKFIGLVCNISLEHRIQFDNTHLKNIRWESSKRLLYGSLVCLSRDDFQSMYFAVVTNRERKDLEEGIIQVRFENGVHDILDAASEDTFTMTETSAYFEAYRHVLEGLQEMKTSFPLARYIVECKIDIIPPKYLPAHGTTLNLRHCLRTYTSEDPHMLELFTTRWSSFEETPLDQSQYDAVETALTKEIAIIQGPPGTGKTYVGLKVVQILLDNRQVWTQNTDPKPMLVVCYTNHALDQFLGEMAEFCPNGIVRVGSRCKNDFLEQFNLKKIRSLMRIEKKVRFDIRNSIKDCCRELSVLRERVERVSATLEATTKGIIGETALQMEMPEKHYKSLLEKHFDMTGRPNSIMMYWLTEGMLMISDDKGEVDDCKSLEKKVTQKILEGTELKQELSFERSEILCLHPKKKAQMYRFWLNKIKDQLRPTLAEETDANSKQLLVKLEDQHYTKEILPDSMLKQVMDSSIFSAITQASSQSSLQQNDYSVKAWLGLSTDRNSLQNLLDQLLEEDEVDEEEDKLNAEEDAEYMQRERQLDNDDDDDDGFFDFAKRHKYSVKDAIIDLGIITTEGKDGERNMGGWLIPKQYRKQQSRKVQHLIRTSQAMSEEESSSITDVWSQDQKDRVRLYLYWRDRYQTSLKQSIKVQAEKYETEAARLRELKFAEDRDIMRSKAVIGMTTTGAARYRTVLRDIGCPIVLLEEAAEVLEAHVVTTLSESCQHLILIGDHQQLRPSPTVFELSKFYNLDISLFERLIKNQLHHTTLTLQHRMKPEIANFVRHVYPTLEDHVSTRKRKNVRGVTQDVFLVHHEFGETRTKETSSKLNDHEADFCLCLCRYLLQQDYTASHITLLTGYSGQVSALKSRMRKDAEFFKGVRVTTVDNYQGEENDIIILSLVRSNEEGNVGFLGTDNRVCVALSRARDGLYAIGNFKILAEKSDLWKKIVKTAKENNQLGNGLILRCQNHPDTETKVSCKDDFKHVPEGGCKKRCAFKMSCGHVCEKLCHGYDRDHMKYQCKKKCERMACNNGHMCQHKCFEPCGKCTYKIEKIIPMCGHKAWVECHRDPRTWHCAIRCNQPLAKCGHQCTGKCGHCRDSGRHADQCAEEVERAWPCGHLIKVPCHATPATRPCSQPCEVKLECGHVCQGTCGECLEGRVHKDCGKSCNKLLPGCGHVCRLPCGSKCLPCKEKTCQTRCKHGNCALVCGEPCKPCEERCPWKCEHVTCQSFCHTPCQPCGLKCDQRLKCGHLCSGSCAEICLCYKCENDKFVSLAIEGLLSKEECPKVDDAMLLVKLPECKHIFRADALDDYVEKTQFTPDKFLLCPVCNTPVKDWDCWRYHSKIRERRLEQEKSKAMLKTSSLVSQERQDKIFRSMDMLKKSQLDPRSFASSNLQSSLKSGNLDVNMCFALTNQIKLARVIEMVEIFLLKPTVMALERDIVSDLQVDLETLKRVVLPPVNNMSGQRCQKMMSEMRRLVYIALLAAVQGIPSCYMYHPEDTLLSLQRQTAELARTLRSRKEGIIPTAEYERVINECRRRIKVYNRETAGVDLSILNASPEVDLCDIEQV